MPTGNAVSPSREKHEWLDGTIYAMAGGTQAHAALTDCDDFRKSTGR